MQSGGFEKSHNSSNQFLLNEREFSAVFGAHSVAFEFPRGREVSLRFFGSDPAVRIKGEGLLPGQTTFFLSGSRSVSRWFDRVVYKSLYPGIDLAFYKSEGRLEYDFVIAPGADPMLIDLAWEGERHNLIQQRNPVAYQMSGSVRNEVHASVVELGSHLHFELGNYDSALPLTIDPVLVYTNYVGGDRTDTPSAVTVDSQGNVYLAGTTSSYNFTRTQAGPAYPLSGNLLVSADGGQTFARAGINNSVLAMASTSTALVAGTTAGPYRSLDGGVTWQVSNNGLANFATNALLTDARFPGRVFAGTDQGLFRSDDSGITWNTTGSGLPAHFPVKVIVSSLQQPSVVFVVTTQGVYRSPDSGQTWTLVNLPISPAGPAPASIATDPGNPMNVYIAGAYSNTSQQAFILKSTDAGVTFKQISALATLPFPQAIAIDPANSSSLFAAGIDGSVYQSVNGGVTWAATSLTQVTLDAIAFDANHPGNLYAVADQGLLLSADHGTTWLPTGSSVPKRDLRSIFFTPSTIFLGQDAGEHVFLSKWNPAGNLLWSIVAGGSYFDDAAAVAVDASGSPYLSGITGSTDFPVTPGAFQSTCKGFQCLFLMKLNAAGNQITYSTLFGGSASDGISAMAVDPAGSVYLTGYAVSPNFPTTPHSYQPRHIGSCNGNAGGDAYVSKFSADGSTLAYSTLIGGSCAQISTALALDSTGHVYITGATVSPDFPVTTGVIQPVYGGSTDGFLAEFTQAGDALIFSTYLGGQNSDIAAGVAVDSSGNILVGGNGFAFPFAAQPPASPTACSGVLAAYGGLPLSIASPPYLLKVNPGATGLESLVSFSDCGTIVQGFAMDASGKAWLGGIVNPAIYDTIAPFQTLHAGSFFVRQFAADARTTLFSTLLDSFQSLALDSAGAAYISGAGTAPGIVKQVLITGTAQPSAMVSKINASTANAVDIDTVQKLGTLSIPSFAGYEGPIGIAPGELIAINGHGLGPAVAAGSSVVNGLLQTTLANIAVLFDGTPAPLIAVQNNQIVCVTPYELSGKHRSQIQVVNLGIGSNPVIVSAVAAAAEVLTLVNQDGTSNSAANPAAVGSIMTLYASGFGVPASPVADGSIGVATQQSFASAVSVVFDDPATITYLGPAPGLVSGITQVNFVVPQIDGQTILSVSAGASTDYVYVYVQ